MSLADIEDLPFRTVDGQTLLGRLYRPQTGGPAPFVVDAHGGAWGSGDRLNNEVIHRDLAARGIGIFALDFRLSSVARYPAPVDDVSFGVRWFRANAARLGLEAAAVGGLGASSGGQQMGLVALCPGGAEWTTPDPALENVDAALDFFVACWPILDPLARYRMVQANGNDRLVAAHEAYFADEAAMTRGNPHLLLERDAATRLPPTLIVQGTGDANVQHDWQDRFAGLYRAKGGDIRVEKFDGQPHTFVTADPDTPASKAAIRTIGDFILGR